MTRVSHYHQSTAHFVSEGVPFQIAEADVEFVPHGTKICHRDCHLNRSRMKARSPSAATITLAISAQKRSSNWKSFVGWVACSRAALPRPDLIGRDGARDRSKHNGPTWILSHH